jgi:hypothetical protein
VDATFLGERDRLSRGTHLGNGQPGGRSAVASASPERETPASAFRCDVVEQGRWCIM